MTAASAFRRLSCSASIFSFYIVFSIYIISTVDEGGDDGTKVLQKVPFLSPELLSLVDWQIFLRGYRQGNSDKYVMTICLC